MNKRWYYLFLVLIVANAIMLGLSAIGLAVESLGSSNSSWSAGVAILAIVFLILSFIGALVCCLTKPKKDKKDGDDQKND